jgi:CRP-like cAMP-binding protein
MGPDYTAYMDALKKCVLFDDIGEIEINKILHCLNYRIIQYKKNDYMILLNQKLDGVGIVLNGEAAVVKENINGNRIIVNTFHVGEMFGEVLILSRETEWPATIQALSDCVIMYINPEKILDICENVCSHHKVLLSNLVRVVSKKAYDLNRKVEYLSLKSINGKLSKYLLEQSAKSGKLTFKLPLNREKLADFLNISRPSMSRELGNMRDKGIIDFHGDLFRIKDEGRLRELLEE